MTLFSDLGLAEPILRAIEAEGYTTPTPIQAKVIPAMMAGRDVLGTAQTGTGKTAAFTLPIIERLGASRTKPREKTCRALILAPTRELAAQIEASVRTYGRHTRLTTALVVGGVKPSPQIRALARGVDVLIATPGRLEDHMRGGAVNLSAVEVAVLDEADQMLDLGFMPAIRRLFKALPSQRQTALLSATMPHEIRVLAKEFLRDPEEIAVAPVSRPVEAVTQSVLHVDEGSKREALLRLLADPTLDRAIVFTRTKRGADKVTKHLTDAGHEAAAIHGNKSQPQRERALGSFRDGRVKILVATDIAARGIDIDGVSHVFNFELPNVPEAYVHRIGRTARAGRSGVAVSLCDASERKLLRDIERLIGRRLEASGDASAEPVTTAGATPQRSRRPAPRTPQSSQPAGGQQDTRATAPAARRRRRRPGGPGNPNAPTPGQRPAKRPQQHTTI